MSLSFVAEKVHLELVQTLIAAELQLLFAVLKVDIIDGMSGRREVLVTVTQEKSANETHTHT